MTRLTRIVWAGCFLLSAATAALADDFPPGPDQPLVEKACTSCHLGTQVTSQHKTADQWADTVNEMIANGAEVGDDDYNKIVTYLAANFGPEGATPPPSSPANADPAAMPAAPQPTAGPSDQAAPAPNP